MSLYCDEIMSDDAEQSTLDAPALVYEHHICFSDEKMLLTDLFASNSQSCDNDDDSEEATNGAARALCALKCAPVLPGTPTMLSPAKAYATAPPPAKKNAQGLRKLWAQKSDKPLVWTDADDCRRMSDRRRSPAFVYAIENY